MNEKRHLLCSFSSIEIFKNTIEEIKRFYQVYHQRFFVFTNINSPKEVFITYNIFDDGKEFLKFPNTISIHRKKNTNTLFTLNSMNQLIKDNNNGVLDKSVSIDWSLYKDSLVISGESVVRVIPIKLLEIFNND